MSQMIGSFDPSGHSLLGILIVLGYPALVLAALELARGLGQRREFASSVLGQIAYLVLPTGAIWLILEALAGLPRGNWAVRTAETVFALTSLYVLLSLAQAALTTFLDDNGRAPKLLLDILRISVSLVWSAVVVSNIWNVDLRSLLAAMGVGSIVLGFALQEFLGNLLSGLGLLWAHKFGIGDWIVVDGAPARVVEMDWRTVTLAKGDGARIVVANSTLAKGNLTIAARADETASVSVALAFGLDIPPERVRKAVLEAARSVPGLPAEPAAKCIVTGISGAVVNYAAILPVANPGVLSGPRDEFLSRFWYVAQRHGLWLGAPEAPSARDADARLRMLGATGAFREDPEALKILARTSVFRQYRRADVVLPADSVSTEAFLVLAGSLSFSVSAGSEVRLELVGPGQLLVLQETLAESASPVQVQAHDDADVLAIPASSLHEVMAHNRVVARDISALAEARRLALQRLNRSLRAVA
jgi:small-conductance mechanosensitive channel/CRP-like cAMP-binding protein